MLQKTKKSVRSLLLLAGMGLAFVACNRDSDSSTDSGSSSGTGGSTTNPVTVTSCESQTGINKIICLADAFKASLSTTQLAQVQLSYSKTDAVRWSNFPQQLFSLKRVGLNFGSMTTEQIALAKALLKEVAGSSISGEGYDELEQILNSDDYLLTYEKNGGYGSANYYIAFLGTPATTGTFEIQFGGHHIAFANTYKDGVLVGATPSFRGVEPAEEFTYNNRSNQPMKEEIAAFKAMIQGLSATELATAKISTRDLVAGPQQDNVLSSLAYSGVKVGNLTSAQKELVRTAIKTYVQDVAEYEKFMTIYENELDNTYIAYNGTTNFATTGDYVRIHGPSVFIELAMQGTVTVTGVSTRNSAHIHSVWRDKTRDYGGN